MSNAADRGGATPHRTTLRVRYPETDRMGVAYHANFLVWFELGRTELMRELGCTYEALETQQGIYFPVIEARARYHAPAGYDDLLTVWTRLVSVGAVRIRFEYRVTRDDERTTLLATGSTEHAAVDSGRRLRRVPKALKKRLESHT